MKGVAHAPAMPTIATPLRSLAHRLDAEWTVLRHERDALRHAAEWHLVDTDPTSLDDILVAIGFRAATTGIAPGDGARQAHHLRRLVELAGDDPLAARVVLQRLLPALVAVARRRATASASTAQRIDEVIAAAWIAITTFNPGRRPASLAAALVADADDRAFRQAWRRASATEVITGGAFDDVADATPTHPDVEVAALLRLARDAGMPAAELDLIRRLLADETTDDLARELALTSRAVRYRRAQITGRLRDLALAA